MFQLTDHTPFKSEISLLTNEHGIDSLIVISKAGFRIGSRWTLLEEQSEPYQADEYYGDPLYSSLKAASAYHLPKKSTDIIIHGKALAPTGHSARALPVQVQVARLCKRAIVYGNRYWDKNRMSEPELFESLPLLYEYAYGGQILNEDGEIVDSEMTNPVGTGFHNKELIEKGELPFPNIENPLQLIQSPHDVVTPTGFGYVAPNWLPRVNYTGTYDENWTQNRAPFFPLDFDKRFYSMASTGLVYPGYLQGGEPVHIKGMTESGELSFTLPHVGLAAKLTSAAPKSGLDTVLPMDLETIEVNPNELELHLTWKAMYVSQAEITDINSVIVTLSQQ